MLLMSLKSTKPDVYHQWAEAFPVAYGGTVEDLAQSCQDAQRELLTLSN
jgi:hypothetical protein